MPIPTGYTWHLVVTIASELERKNNHIYTGRVNKTHKQVIKMVHSHPTSLHGAASNTIE